MSRPDAGRGRFPSISWTIEEIEREWLAEGEALMFPAEEVIAAFNIAESIRGREWINSCINLPGGVRLSGFAPLLKVMSFATRAESARGAINLGDLHTRLRRLDLAADSELSAIHLGSFDAE